MSPKTILRLLLSLLERNSFVFVMQRKQKTVKDVKVCVYRGYNSKVFVMEWEYRIFSLM